MGVAFSQTSHDLFDNPGKQAVIKYFERRGYQSHYKKENLGIDLRFTKDGVREIFAEVAIRPTFKWKLSRWDTDAPKSWKTVHIVERKYKYGKPEPAWYGEKAYIFEINNDITEAFVIQPCIIKEEWEKVQYTKRGFEEKMYDVPVEYFRVIDLTK